ncbi:MAG: CHAT domain-containing protein [Desulfobacterales bacterium]|nr:CHAT domain-containing protein [Desulfobacterales bacterium]
MKTESIIFEAASEQGSLKIGISKPDDVIWSYEDISAPMDTIETHCREIVETLNRTSRKGSSRPDILKKLKTVGRMLCDELLTPDIKKELRKTNAHYLILKLDDHLVHIPWELLCIGDQFLCQRFSMGRMVKTRQKIAQSDNRHLSFPIKMWIMANPGGDLNGADSEGLKICTYMDRMNQEDTIIDASLDSNVTPDEIKLKFREFDFIHFAGHADYNPDQPGQSGWKLAQGNFTANNIYKMSGGAAMPALVFSNACQSARTEEWEWKENKQDDSFGLANAFMLAGVRHYVGTFWEITDEPSSRFALEFYENLLSGSTVGESVRQARLKLSDECGTDICWASYILYGDPSLSYFGENEESEEPANTEPAMNPEPVKPYTRASGTGMIFGSKTKLNWQTVLLVIIGLALGILLYFNFKTPHTGISPETLKTLRELALKKKEHLNRSLKELEILLKSSPYDPSSEKPADDWTSTPLTIAMDFKSERLSLNNEKENLISSIIGKQIIDNTRARLLERISLDKIVDELKLANSEMVPPENRLKPEFLTPKLFLFFELNTSDPQPFVLMHLASTEERRDIDIFIEPLKKGSTVAQQKNISARLLKQLNELYPLRGRVLQVSDKETRLNIGDKTGVRIGQVFKVIGKDITLEIVSVQHGTSIAKLKKGENFPEKGQRVEAINE